MCMNRMNIPGEDEGEVLVLEALSARHGQGQKLTGFEGEQRHQGLPGEGTDVGVFAGAGEQGEPAHVPLGVVVHGGP